MNLQNPDWRGYGRPNPSRALALKHDAAGHPLREWAFAKWCRDTVYPDAVNRWIREIGERA